MAPVDVVVLNAADVKRLLPMHECVDVVQEVLVLQERGEVRRVCIFCVMFAQSFV